MRSVRRLAGALLVLLALASCGRATPPDTRTAPAQEAPSALTPPTAIVPSPAATEPPAPTEAGTAMTATVTLALHFAGPG